MNKCAFYFSLILLFSFSALCMDLAAKRKLNFFDEGQDAAQHTKKQKTQQNTHVHTELNFPMPQTVATSTKFMPPPTPRKTRNNQSMSVKDILKQNGYTSFKSKRFNNGNSGAQFFIVKQEDKKILLKVVKSPNDKKFNKIKKENELVRQIKSNNLLEYVKVIEDEANKVFIFETPYYKKGNFKNYANQIELSEEKIISFMKDIAHALHKMHSNNIYHLDVKPENFLVDDNENLVLADFGKIKKFNDDLKSGGGGDAVYAALEIGSGDVKVNAKLDIASFGFTMLEVVSNKKLSTANMSEFTTIRTNKNYVAEHYFDKINLSENIKELILDMIDENPENRPTVQDILQKLENK